MFSKEEIDAINLEAYEMRQKIMELPPGEVVVDTATFMHVYIKRQNDKIYHEINEMTKHLNEVIEIMANNY